MKVHNWAESFKRYDSDNPQIWEMFESFSLEMIRAGHQRISQSLILARIRYETMIRAQGDPFKINQNYGAYYSRKFLSAHPEYEDAFTVRELRSPTPFLEENHVSDHH